MNKKNIRNAVFTDIEQVCTIEAESINSWTYNQFLEEITREFSRFIVIEDSGIITGYVIAWIIADELQINSIAVKKEYRRKGLGKNLLDHIIYSNKSDNISCAYIEVRRTNIEAIHFYKSYGFIETGIRKKYYGVDDAILMEKKLK